MCLYSLCCWQVRLAFHEDCCSCDNLAVTSGVGVDSNSIHSDRVDNLIDKALSDGIHLERWKVH